jgi:hypothetical protein
MWHFLCDVEQPVYEGSGVRDTVPPLCLLAVCELVPADIMSSDWTSSCVDLEFLLFESELSESV